MCSVVVYKYICIYVMCVYVYVYSSYPNFCKLISQNLTEIKFHLL